MLDRTKNRYPIENFTACAADSSSLPGEYYFSDRVFETEQQNIFFKTWQFVCHVSRLEGAGSYYVHDLLDQSIVVLRDRSGQLRAFHNVCQHRAHRLLEGTGELTGRIVCPYHSWAYNLDGRLAVAQRTNRMDTFDASQICLQAVQVDQLAGFIFINLDPHAPDLASTYPGLDAEIRKYSPHPEKLKFAYTKDYPVEANWKVSVENYSECYHCPGCHPSLSTQALDMGSYSITLNSNFHSHLSGDCGDNQGYQLREEGPNSNYFAAWFVWPNVCIEVFPGGYMDVFYHRPIDPERSVQVVEWYCLDTVPTKEEQDVIEFVAEVRDEDVPLCESVQRGLRSKGFSQGRFIVDEALSDHSEHAVHDFQRLVLDSIGAPPESGGI